MTDFKNTAEYARELDKKDPLAPFKKEFHLPTDENGEEKIYLCGNSLGLQPKATEAYVNQELKDWQKLGVEGHTEAKKPWKPYHEFLSESMAKIVGAKKEEVVIMNSLTVNLHLMMASFYRPTNSRYKIIIEKDAFPSDRYAVKSQLDFHGFDADEGLIYWKPRRGEELCRKEDLQELLNEHGHQTALVLIGNTNYYTGQFYPMREITDMAQNAGAKVGFDLAHGAGNIQPELHKTGPDFAVWCTYKYLNGGPGSLGGCFVHERHANDKDIKRFAGWWGHDKETRFNMRYEFDPIPGAEGWQLSNPSILSMAPIRASLDMFTEAGFDNIREKSKKLTAYFEYLLKDIEGDQIEIITPQSPAERGCQLSIKVKNADKELFDQLMAAGVVSDWRDPNVIRVAPAPLYNSYSDVYEMVQRLKKLL